MSLKSNLRSLDIRLGNGTFTKLLVRGRFKKAIQLLGRHGETAEVVFYSGDSHLAELFALYGSDKGQPAGYDDTSAPKLSPWDTHTYAEVYELLFSGTRLHVLNLLECGIGSIDPNVPSNMTQAGKLGASLRAWRSYFPNAHIWGVDIDSKCLFVDERIDTYQVDQTRPESIGRFLKICPVVEFDIIIDDGLHEFEAGKIFFESCFSHLKTGGTYVIEDVRAQDLKKFGEYFVNLKHQTTFIVMPRYSNLSMEDNVLIVIRKSTR